MILDEATNTLQPEMEIEFLKMVLKIFDSSTVIVVTVKKITRRYGEGLGMAVNILKYFLRFSQFRLHAPGKENWHPKIFSVQKCQKSSSNGYVIIQFFARMKRIDNDPRRMESRI